MHCYQFKTVINEKCIAMSIFIEFKPFLLFNISKLNYIHLITSISYLALFLTPKTMFSKLGLHCHFYTPNSEEEIDFAKG